MQHDGVNLSLPANTVPENPNYTNNTQQKKRGIMQWYFLDQQGSSYYLSGQVPYFIS
jgi:hypothetical protein